MTKEQNLGNKKNMTKSEKDIANLLTEGRNRDDKYSGFLWELMRRISSVIELKNPLTGHILVSSIDNIIEIYNPELKTEIGFITRLQKSLKLWCNEKVIANRTLGLKDDNQYDERVFEKAVMEKFFMQLKEKPDSDTVIKTDFKTMVELVELGARRFNH